MDWFIHSRFIPIAAVEFFLLVAVFIIRMLSWAKRKVGYAGETVEMFNLSPEAFVHKYWKDNGRCR